MEPWNTHKMTLTNNAGVHFADSFVGNKTFHTHPFESSQITIIRQIGKNSTFGKVFSINVRGFANGMFVLKYMRFDDSADKKIFMNEVSVGNNIDLVRQHIGPAIVAYKTTKNYGIYIMNDFTMGIRGHTSSTLGDYLKQTYNNSCPRSNSKIITKLKATLLNFYAVTNGYHGDLHLDNIAVILGKNKKLLHVYVFDYGSHRRFRKRLASCDSLYDAFDLINHEFKTNQRRAPNTGFFPENSRVRVIYPRNGQQPYRPNTNVLRELNPSLYKTLFSPKSINKSVNSSTSSSSNRASTPYYSAKKRLSTPYV